MYLCVSACVRIITTVFCVTVLFGSYLPYPSIRVHPTETQYSGERCTASTSSKKGSITRGKHTFHTWIYVCHEFVDFLKIEVVHSILFTINLIFKQIF